MWNSLNPEFSLPCLLPKKMVRSWNPELCKLGNLTSVSTFWVAKVLSIFGQDRWLTSSWLHLSQRKFWCTSYLGKAFVATIRFYLFVCVNVWPGRYHFSWAENLVIDEGQSPQNKIGLCRPCANLGDRSCFFTQTQSPSVYRRFSVWQPLSIANLFSCFIYPTAIGADEW